MPAASAERRLLTCKCPRQGTSTRFHGNCSNSESACASSSELIISTSFMYLRGPLRAGAGRRRSPDSDGAGRATHDALAHAAQAARRHQPPAPRAGAREPLLGCLSGRVQDTDACAQEQRLAAHAGRAQGQRPPNRAQGLTCAGRRKRTMRSALRLREVWWHYKSHSFTARLAFYPRCSQCTLARQRTARWRPCRGGPALSVPPRAPPRPPGWRPPRLRSPSLLGWHSFA